MADYTNISLSDYKLVGNGVGWTSGTVTLDYTPIIGGGYDVYSTAKKKESALDWLDRRVTEMRVAL